MDLVSGAEVEWTNAYNEPERGVITRVDSDRIYIEMMSRRSRAKASRNEVFFERSEIGRLRPRSMP